MRDHAVLIAGGGPTGLMLAAELALAGVDVAIIERRSAPELVGSRAGGLHARTIEILDQRGIADRFLAEGQTGQVIGFHIPLDMGDLPTRHNYWLALWQHHTERLLGDWARELGVPVFRGREVTGFVQDERGVVVSLSDGASLSVEFLVGCDGGRSAVRKAAGIAFPGWDPTTSWLNAEVRWTQEPAWGFRHDATGSHAIGKVEDPGLMRAVLTERLPWPATERTLGDLREALMSVYGTDFGAHSPTWISSFSDVTRQAAAYRDRRVFLAGDAAHVHPPMGGQGLNLGVQDAVNLGWKLAQVVQGTAPNSLLDTYHTERHPVGARVLRTTMAHMALRRTDDRSKALVDLMTDLLAVDGARRRLAAEMSGLAVRYDLGEGHPLLGRRMPDLDLVTADGLVRAYSLLHDGRWVLIDFSVSGNAAEAPVVDRMRTVRATYRGKWELPGAGEVGAPTAVLVRPDGYVSWVREGDA